MATTLHRDAASLLRQEHGGELILVLQFIADSANEGTKMAVSYSAETKEWIRMAVGLEEGLVTLFPVLVEAISRT